jgi:gluconokinase
VTTGGAVRRIVVMGVAASGKSTIGHQIAVELGLAFVDADALHSADNTAKMAAGQPLDDEDRWHWLALVRDELLRDNSIVVACSALKRSYRDVLRQANGIDFVHLDVDPATAQERIGRRRDHFMGPAMVTSQFDALERPSADEDDVVTVDATRSLGEVMEQVRAELGRRSTMR